MSEFDDAMNLGVAESAGVFGTVAVTFEGVAQPVQVFWNKVGTREMLTLAGRTISFSIIVEVAVSALSSKPRAGQKVTKDGVTYRIPREADIDDDGITYRFPLDTAEK